MILPFGTQFAIFFVIAFACLHRVRAEYRMHCTIVLVVSLWSMYQLQLCLGKESPPTILPHFVKAKFIERSAEGSSRSINIYARMLRIEVAKQEILRKLGMKKRPPKMNNLMSTIPKPVFDGEIGSMYSKSEDEEPTKTTQVVIPAEQGLFYTIILSL